MAVQHIKEAEFDEVVLKSDVPVLVDFFAEWCGPCKMMEPILEQASEEVSGAKIVAVDADEAERLCIVYGIWKYQEQRLLLLMLTRQRDSA